MQPAPLGSIFQDHYTTLLTSLSARSVVIYTIVKVWIYWTILVLHMPSTTTRRIAQHTRVVSFASCKIDVDSKRNLTTKAPVGYTFTPINEQHTTQAYTYLPGLSRRRVIREISISPQTRRAQLLCRLSYLQCTGKPCRAAYCALHIHDDTAPTVLY